MKVYIDANYFVALSNPEDSLHAQTLVLNKKLYKEQATLVISNYTFLEAVTVVSQRVDREASRLIGRNLLQDRHIELVHISEELHQRSWQVFQSQEKKNISFVDCSIIAVMEFEQIPSLLTFDTKDFASLQQIYPFTFFTE